MLSDKKSKAEKIKDIPEEISSKLDEFSKYLKKTKEKLSNMDDKTKAKIMKGVATSFGILVGILTIKKAMGRNKKK